MDPALGVLTDFMTRQQRLVLVIAVLASFVAFLDSSVINVALPAMTGELGGGLTVQQLWHAVPSYPTASEVWLRLLDQAMG